MAWWLTTARKRAWAPAPGDFKYLPAYRAEAHRMFLSGKGYWLLRM